LSKFLALWLALLYGWTACATAHPNPDPPTALPAAPPVQARSVRLAKGYGRLPLSFEPNQGQADGRVKFLSRGPGYTMFLTASEAVLALEQPGQKSRLQGEGSATRNSKIEKREPDVASGHSLPVAAFLRMKLLGASSSPLVRGEDQLPGRVNYFIGSDPSRWHTNLPTYARVRYGRVYPGVDLIFYGGHRRLEYDFVVAAGADPRAIRLDIETPKSKIVAPLKLDSNGGLAANTDAGEVRFQKPVVYQPAADGSRRYLDGRYVIRAQSKIANPRSEMVEVGFEVGPYDRSKPLVIDPVLLYSTYLGGNAADLATGVALDSAGNAYVTGSTLSTNFPTAPTTTPTPLQKAGAGDADVFVSKLNPTGSTLVYSTYLGGIGFDKGTGIAVDASGNAYVTGYTNSSNFPTTTGSAQTAYGGSGDAFVAKLKPDGSALVYSTYLGGSGADFGLGIALDSSGEAYVTGSTQSTNFPTAPSPGALQTANHGVSDAFVAKVKADGSGLVYSTYLGGSGADSAQGIAVDSSGAAYVTGYTYSPDFPTAPTGSAIQAQCGGFSSGPPPSCASADVFVAKLSAAGSALVYSTYLGGSGTDRGFAIAVDSLGSAYVTGDSDSTDYPATVGALQGINAGKADAFVAKLNPTGTTPLVYFTFLGGSDIEQGTGIAVDSATPPNAYVTGSTTSTNFPTFDPLQPSLGGGTCGAAPNTFPCPDAFVSKLNAQASALLYSTYFGGGGADYGEAIAIDSATPPNAYVVGSTASLNFPALAGTFQPTLGGAPSDAFVAKVGPNDGSGVALAPQTVAFGNQGTGVATAPQAVTLTNVGSAALNISNVTFSGTNATDFALTTPPPPPPPPAPAPLSACPTSGAVTAGGTCAFYITFNPAALGAAVGTLVIADDAAAGSPQQVSLTGTGVKPAPAATFSPTSIDFTPDPNKPQPFGVPTASQTVTLTNTGTAPLSITTIAITGDFTQKNTCAATPPTTKAPATLGIGASCTFTIVFTPAGAGGTARGGNLTVTDNASPTTQTVSLVGDGLAQFSLCATNGAKSTACSASAGDSSKTVTVGTTSETFYVAATALSSFTGSINLTCVATSGASCAFNPTPIKAGQTTTVTVNGLSASTASPLNFNVTGTSSTQSTQLPLTINLADFTVTATPALALTKAGDPATYTVTVTPSNGFNQKTTLGCLNSASTVLLPPHVTCAFTPPTVTPNGSAPITAMLTVTTEKNSVSGPRSGRRPTFPVAGTRPLAAPWLLSFLALATLATLVAAGRWPHAARHGRRRLGLSRLVLAVAMLFVLVWAGCENFGVSPIGTPTLPGTPPGNYTLVVQGTLNGASGSSSSSSVTRSTTVNLSVSRSF